MDEQYLTKLASSEPTPGGGSAAMVCGSLACALVAMVARICHDLPLAERADVLRARMEGQRAADEQAFSAVVAAKGDRDAMQRALTSAASAPLEGARLCVRALELTREALELRNRHLTSDVACANEFACAALRACAHNVRINHKYIKDAQTVSSQAAELADVETRGLQLYRHIALELEAAFTAPA